ncbi:MAG: methyl-accepting chemotaxis protein [Huintestinicola sp.]
MNLLSENEKSANLAAAKVMRITVIVFAMVLLLDIIGIFTVKLPVMITAFLIGCVFLLIPTLLVNVLKNEGKWVKYVIVLSSIIFTAIVTVTLAYHAVLLFVYPIAIASLYFLKKLNYFTVVFTLIAVSVGQLLCFKFQFVKDDNFASVKTCLLYGILPRAMVLICISAIFTMLSSRTASMLGSLMGAEQQRILREKSLEVSERLIQTVTELDSISTAAAVANRSIADESGNVMKDSEDNFSHIKSVEESMNHISDNLRDLSEMSARIAELTKRADQITAENDSKMSAAAASMDEICKGTEESKEIISKLSEQSKKIVEIAEVISDISMQTNILALNASVEAAHAGEHGRGFSVVADEIKKLSEQTKEAASEIGEIIADVTQNISGTVEAMENNAVLTREGMNSMEEMKASAEQLSHSNREISVNISDMNSVIKNVADSGENVSKKLVSVSGNIANNCSAVQHMAAAIQENSAGTENLGFMVKNIRQMAGELEQLTK